MTDRLILSEYSEASVEWFSNRVREISPGFSELYEQMRWEEHASVHDSIIRLSDNDVIVIPVATLSATAATSISQAINSEFENLHDAVIDIADQFVQESIRTFLEGISEITEATGQVVNATDNINENMIATIEVAEFAFDDDGTPRMQWLIPEGMAEELRQAEQEMTDEQAARLAAIIDRKRREYFASRRHRRLPRHGH